MDTLDQEVAAQKTGATPTPIRLPEAVTRAGKLQEDIRRIVSSTRCAPLAEFLLHNNKEAESRMVVTLDHATLIRPYATVPVEELDRMIILDASFPIRALLTLGNRNMSEEAKAQGLQVKTFEEVWPWIKPAGVKRYDHVTIHVMQTKRSGRQYSIDDADFAGDIVKEIVKVVASIPANEPVLVWTFLPPRDVPVDFGSNIRNALVKQLGAEAASRVIIDTFGRETASNAYKHIKYVIFQGCLELPPEVLAGQYIAETRNLGLQVTKEDIELLNRSEIWHRIYQGLNRAACREAWVDEHGQTQAKKADVWLFTRHHRLIQSELGPALPGVKWETWWPEHMTKEELSKDAAGAVAIKETLAKLALKGNQRVSLKALKQMSPILRDLAKRTFPASARHGALGR
jgi:hypothetical protein